MILNTCSSVIRPWTREDCDSLVRHANNLHIARCMRDGFPYPYTLDDADRFIGMATGDHQDILLAIELDGLAAGGIGIHMLSDVYRRIAEIGYWLAELYWGRGIVSEAIRSLLPVAFRERDIIRIQAGVFSNNPASMRVLEKNGFVLEAVHKHAITKEGKTLDEYLYVIFRDDIG